MRVQKCQKLAAIAAAFCVLLQPVAGFHGSFSSLHRTSAIRRIGSPPPIRIHRNRSLQCRKPSAILMQGSVTSEEEIVETEESVRPKVGDVVQYRGKWKDEVYLGEIKGLQSVSTKWIADVLPLKDIGKNQYARERNWGTKVQDVSTLRPVKAFYVRSVDAFQVRVDEKSGDFLYLAPSYDLDNFVLPTRPPIDPSLVEMDLAEYEALKTRLLKDTLLFGGFASIVTALTFGVENGLIFSLGAATSAFYVLLLGRNADKIGTFTSDGGTQAGKNSGNRSIDLTRFALPIVLVGVLALSNYIRSPEEVRLLHLVRQDQFGAAMLGFLTSYRLPLLYREITRSGGIDMVDVLPGSIAKGTSLLRKVRKGDGIDDQLEAARSLGDEVIPILVVSGPRGLGREKLIEQVMSEQEGSVALAKPTWCTARPKRDGEDSSAYIFMDTISYEQQRAAGAFLQLKTDRSGVEYGLRAKEILDASTEGKLSIVDADTDLVKKLIGIEKAALIGVWVSEETLPAIENTIRKNIQEGGYPEGIELESLVRANVKSAVGDIEFGVTCGVFEFTIIGFDENRDAAVRKLKKAISYAR